MHGPHPPLKGKSGWTAFDASDYSAIDFALHGAVGTTLPRRDLQAGGAFSNVRAEIGSQQRSRQARLAGRAGLHR